MQTKQIQNVRRGVLHFKERTAEGQKLKLSKGREQAADRQGPGDKNSFG